MSLSGTWRSRTLIAAVMVGAFALPPQLAAAEPAPAPAPAAEKTAAKKDAAEEGRTITMKVGISQKELAHLRAKGREARDAGHKSLPVPDVSLEEARKDGPVKRGGASADDPLTVLEGEGAARKAAADQVRTDMQARMADQGMTKAAAEDAAVAAAKPKRRGWVPIKNKPHAQRLEACFEGDGANTGIGRVYNRFTYCANWNLKVDYWSVDNSGVPIEHEGTTKARLKVFGQGDAKERRVRIFSQIEEDSVDYDWGPIDNIFTAPGVPLSLMGQCSQGLDVCTTSPSSYTYPWATWDNNPVWAWWDVFNHDNKTEGRDKLAYNQWYVEAFTDTQEYKTLDRGETPERLARCDSGDYFNYGRAEYPEACVFPESYSYLTYTRGSSHDGVAEHLWTAFTYPNSTYPLVRPPMVKKIPGEFKPLDPSAPGLHRITKKLHPKEYKENSDHKDGACFKTGPYRHLYQDTGLPNGTGEGEECDEYPFASTLEGAGNKDWDFSVKPVNSKQNKVAGGLLRKFVLDDRVIAWDDSLDKNANDRYYVKIK